MSLRRTVLSLTLIAFSAASIGFPIPEFGEFTATSDEDFPCKRHNCGCRDAETCRTSCCCGFSTVVQEEESGGSCCSKSAGKDFACEMDPSVASHSVGMVIGPLTCKGVSVMLIAMGIVMDVSLDEWLIPPCESANAVADISQSASPFSLDPLLAPPRA